MRDWIIRLEATERPDGSIYVSSPTFPLFSVIVQKSENVPQRAFDLLKQYMEINANRQFSLQAAEDASALFDGVDRLPNIPTYVIAQAAA